MTFFWVAILWQINAAPIVLPTLSDTRAACLETAKQINAIAIATVKINRQYDCYIVIKP